MLANKYPLGYFSTPLEKMSDLSQKYEDYQLFIKRYENYGLAS